MPSPETAPDSTYSVEVESDFIEKITRAQPVAAVAEQVWNSLDADATDVRVTTENNELGLLNKIIVQDNGTGIPYADAPSAFRSLGGSWKRTQGKSRGEGRFLHGQEGRGRFKAFALGHHAEWDVVYRHGQELRAFVITMSANSMKKVSISAERSVVDQDVRPGVTLTISDLVRDFRSLTTDAARQDLIEILALYLVDYSHVSVSLDGVRLDPSSVIANRVRIALPAIHHGQNYAASLDVVEWLSATNRALYLCTDSGFPLLELERRFHVGPFQFTGHIRSSYINRLQAEGTAELSELNPHVTSLIDSAKTAIKEHFRTRAAQDAQNVVTEWKEENVYPYTGEAATRVEEAERQLFDIVAVSVARSVDAFAATPQKHKALHLRLLRQALERGPEELQLILSEVLALPPRKLEELAQLLRDVSLSAVISSAKVVADRLKFLDGLDSLVFDQDTKARLRERTQLHRIIAQNCWLFGEEYNLSVDDRSLTEVLRKHKGLLGDDTVVDAPVKHVSKDRGIVDLVLSKAIRRHGADALTHLVVELKAPKVKVNRKEIQQIEDYAKSIIKDERFKGVNTTWVFWVISDDYGEDAIFRMTDDSGGLIYDKNNVSIWVKTWAQVLHENRSRLQFFQEKLEYQVDKGTALKHLQEHYARFLEGVVVEEADAGAGSGDGRHTVPVATSRRGKRRKPDARLVADPGDATE